MRIQNSVKHHKVEFLAKTIIGFSPSTIFAKTSILDVWQGSKYASELLLHIIRSQVQAHETPYQKLRTINWYSPWE